MDPSTDCSASRLCGGSRSIKARPDCGTAVTTWMSRRGRRGRPYGRPDGVACGPRNARLSRRSSTNPDRSLKGCGRSCGRVPLVEAADHPEELALDQDAVIEHRGVFLVRRLEAD